MKWIRRFIPVVVCIVLASIYIYPIFLGLILLPLDLLVSNSNPWLYASTILLKNSFMQDSIIQMFPWKHLTFASLTSGVIPLWNPYQFMGVPFMAGMKPLVFYPANILFLFGEIQSWNGLLWLQLFLSLLFSYIFVRSLGIGKIVCVISSIAFAFSSLMIGVLEFGSEGHVLLWMPILLYFVKRFVESKTSWYLLGISVSVACSLFAGHLQYFAYLIALTFVFAVFEVVSGKNNGKQLIWIALAIVMGVGIAAIQLLPGIELFLQSYRGLGDSYGIFANGLLKPYSFLRLLSPDWFGNPISHDLRGGYIESSGYFGIVPLFFAFYAIWNDRKQKYVRFFTVIAVIALLFSMDGIAQFLYRMHIPIVTSGYGGRLFVLVLFSGAVLSAFGLNAFLKQQEKKQKMYAIGIYTLVVGVCFLGGLLVKRWGVPYAVTFSNIKIQIVALIGLVVLTVGYVGLLHKNRFLKTLFIIAILLLTYADLFRMGYRFLTFSNPKFLYPELPVVTFVRSYTDSSLGRVYGITEPEIHSVFQVSSPETYNPLYPLRTALLLQALEVKTGEVLPTNKYYLVQNERMKYVLDFLGVSVIVPGKGKNVALEYWHSPALQNDLTKIYEDNESDVYENVKAYPRYGLYYDVQDRVEDKDALRMIEDQAVDFRKTVLIREDIQWVGKQGSGSAELLSKTVNTLQFSVRTDTNAVFYLSDTYFPGWHATVNGIPVPILHANYNFRAVEVPAGESKVVFWYFPKSFEIGVWISGISGLLLFAAGVFVLIQKKRDKTKHSE